MAAFLLCSLWGIYLGCPPGSNVTLVPFYTNSCACLGEQTPVFQSILSSCGQTPCSQSGAMPQAPEGIALPSEQLPTDPRVLSRVLGEPRSPCILLITCPPGDTLRPGTADAEGTERMGCRGRGGQRPPFRAGRWPESVPTALASRTSWALGAVTHQPPASCSPRALGKWPVWVKNSGVVLSDVTC